jgi:hypothetical protein
MNWFSGATPEILCRNKFLEILFNFIINQKSSDNEGSGYMMYVLQVGSESGNKTFSRNKVRKNPDRLKIQVKRTIVTQKWRPALLRTRSQSRHT